MSKNSRIDVRKPRTGNARCARGASKMALTTTLLALVGICAFPHGAQDEPPNGINQARLTTHAITNATVVIRPGETLDGGTILIRDGMIEAVGSSEAVTIPAGAKRWDATGLHVYAGLIDAAVMVDPGEMPESPAGHWITSMHPEWHMADRSLPAASLRNELRTMGFTAAAVYPSDGLFRGTGTVVALTGPDQDELTLRHDALMATGFDRGRGYPSSLMGSIAALRQTLLDAQWYDRATSTWRAHPAGDEPPQRSDSLAALGPVVRGEQAVLFHVGDEHAFLRAARIIEEFDLNAVVLGSGLEFRRLNEVAATGLPVVLPLDFPARPDVTTLSQADGVTLRDMMTWEQAPTNARRLLDRGTTIALTTSELDRRRSFFPNLRLAIHNGLTEEDALAALTTVPASMLGIDDVVGTVEPGKLANLVVVEGKLFDRTMKVRDTWVNGQRFEVNPPKKPQYKGKGTLVIDRAGADAIRLPVTIDTGKGTVEVALPDRDKPLKARKVTFDGTRLQFLISGEVFGEDGYVQMASTLSDDSFAGTGALPDRSRFTFTIAPTEGDGSQQADNAPDARREAEVDDAGKGNGDGADEQSNVDRDPVTGDWAASVESAQFGEIPIAMSLTLADDGTVTGDLNSEFFVASVEEGRYDRESAQLTIRMVAEGMSTRLVVTVRDNQFQGRVEGESFEAEISGTRSAPADASTASARDRGGLDEQDLAPEELVYPLGAYGLATAPAQQNVLITNATIWTSGPRGILENGVMLVRDGKIEAIGDDITLARSGSGPREDLPGDGERVTIDGIDYTVIDARDKHVTPGLIDAHSHTGIDGGVNEGSQAVTAEVRIEDVIDPDDINWYRQLAGGLTAANQLHGSANPIGGQNSVVKLKWSGDADAYRVEDAIAGIKFALGENVKRSTSRYPNTRMGVETMIRDAFTRARDYRDRWNAYHALPASQRTRTIPPRRDLELDALVEILEGERLVHCHSYRQDEILALIRVADEFGFTIGTLQHILEGYKVAEAIAQHGAGASSFSDWWAYKMEVMDAIPYNGALMNDVGVVVSFNSDSSELARRMNTEASKAVRYGGVAPHEALKFVTLNPAKQLRIDHRTGSLEVGKDADFVIWSADPLSTYARAEQTWIDGAQYFSIERDQQLRKQVNAERTRLIQKILTKAHGDLSSEGDRAGDEEDAASDEGSPDRRGGARRGQRRRGGGPGVDLSFLLQGWCVSNVWVEQVHAEDRAGVEAQQALLNQSDAYSCTESN